MLNLSGSQDFDSLRVTDLIASEFLSFPGIAVIPVNRTLAELARRGKTTVETPEDAVELARAFGADATIVTAVTEYDPYDPPVIGLVMQWYTAAVEPAALKFDPVTASRMASDPEVELSVTDPTAPHWQVQRVFNAADESVLRSIRAFAAQRDGHASPYGWRRYTQSQELYVRCTSWSLIRSMLSLDQSCYVIVEPNEAD